MSTVLEMDLEIPLSFVNLCHQYNICQKMSNSKSLFALNSSSAFFSVFRHVVQLVVIWAVSGLLALPEAMVLHAVSSFKDQPCVR